MKFEEKMDFSQLKDEELAQMAQAISKSPETQDHHIQSIYHELYKRYYSHSFYLTRYYGLSHSDADDAVQESFINLYKSLDTYHNDRPFKPWFFKILLNQVRKKYNENKHNQHTDIDDVQDLSDPSEKNFFEKLQFRLYLKDITNRLPKKLREVILLKVFSGLTTDEIAKATDISPRQVANRLNQGYEVLKKLLEDNL